MSSASPIDRAVRRLQAALDALEGVVEDRLGADAKLAELEGELQRIGLDRSRLAQSVDAAESRAERLESANQEVSRRLVGAMETIRGVLDRDGAG
ncbi:hypothetical protein C3941_16870 [Kaistia algarum]|jgi:chromosome segregation ATPase|uniref:DUF4164 domain-containing protein n=1 Tax=Kaistia algarum TaxID=2083279 RepID=UPI000CE79115|nr:DUF4164 domain-containing protein [Kaistia algarum]MCX5516364.1 DUF4164 domain-containing protein [Kaistia algarum]PPE78720.1 hypothetical protein C3941_16870 [Kaistia algarum]